VREPELRLLDRATVERCVAAFDPLDVVESILRSHANADTVLPAEAYMEWSNQADAYCRSIAMPGGVLVNGEPCYGVKVINAAVSNPAIGLDRAGGITLLFDPETARPALMADAGYLSGLRTAAYTLVSLRHLGPREYESVSVIGCGALAREHLRLLARYQPGVKTVYLYDLDPGRIGALAAWVTGSLPGWAAVPCGTAEEAVGASHILITLTTSRSPYIEPGWFRPGSFVAHVSLDDLTEKVFVQAEAVFVDDVTLVQDNPRRILGRLMAEGTVSAPAAATAPKTADTEIAGTLGDVLTGRCQAVRPTGGVVVSNPFGMSILDVGLLQRAAAVAEAGELGHCVQIFGGLGTPEG
jgi:ornithine cyclodeaminase/alanine dehydrogenase-like protein (mu-crystallin family)